MEVDFESIAPEERYKWLCAIVIPRPIALVTTRSAKGVDNAAPFSFFNVFSEDPPLVILGLQARPDGTSKDTTRNIRRSGEFVVNLVNRPIAEAMNLCATAFPSGVSELARAGLTPVPCRDVDACRIQEAPFSLECRRTQILAVNAQRDIVVGEVLRLHAQDGLVGPADKRVDLAAYAPVGRLFGDLYAPIADTFSLRRIDDPGETET